MENIRPNHERARIAILLIWIYLGVEVISFMSGYMQYELLLAIQNGETISDETTYANDLREMGIAVFALIIYIISVITFLRWYHRASFNLHRLTTRPLAYTEGWAVGSWFVPFICLYRPYKVTEEMYEEASWLLAERNGVRHLPPSFPFLGWWWGLWILNNLVGHLLFRYSMSAERIDELIISSQAEMVSNLLGIPLAILAIKVIREYSHMEDQLYTSPVRVHPENPGLTN